MMICEQQQEQLLNMEISVLLFSFCNKHEDEWRNLWLNNESQPRLHF